MKRERGAIYVDEYDDDMEKSNNLGGRFKDE